MSEENIAKLTEEYLASIRSGEHLTPEAFASSHSEFQAELMEVLPMLSGMEEISKTQPYTPPAVPRTQLPARLGEFDLLGKLGSGGMGTVFRARQNSLNREVALKLLSPVWSNDAALVKKFEKESMLIASLHHPNIVQVFGAGRDGDFSFYVMELIAGRSLDIRTKRSPREAARLILQAADALAYAHANHVLHRDIKPANFLVDERGDLHISDFGIAAILNENEPASMVTQSHDGTLRYVSPERLIKNENTCASDQYSLGASLYELLANRPIFPESSPGAVVKRIGEHDIPPLEGVPRDLAAIAEKSLSYSPGDRYSSVAEMAADLRRFLNGEAVRARRSSVFRRLFLWSKRRPAVAAWSAAAVLLAAALAAALTVGYLRTRRALGIADRTLYEIFNTYADQPGTRNTELLLRLLPYYEAVSSHRKTYANEVIGTIALRSGKAAIAEKAFRQTPDRFKLAESLAAQGKTSEAQAIWRELAAGKDVTAVRSLCALAGHLRAMPGKEQTPGGDPEKIDQAWKLLESLRKTDPENPELRYLAAAILSENPRLGRGENAIEILKKLVGDRPDNPAYRLLLLRLAGKINPKNPNFDSQIRFALTQADELLSRHPNEPEVLATAADVRLKYAVSLAKNGKTAQGIRELERAAGLYSILVRHPDAPPEGREKLELLEQRLGELKRKMEKNRE